MKIPNGPRGYLPVLREAGTQEYYSSMPHGYAVFFSGFPAKAGARWDESRTESNGMGNNADRTAPGGLGAALVMRQ